MKWRPIKLEMKNRRKIGKSTNMWKLENTLLTNESHNKLYEKLDNILKQVIMKI